MAARARCGDRLMKHRRGGKIPHCSSPRRQRGFNPTRPADLAAKWMSVRCPRQRVRTKSGNNGSAAAFDLKFRSEFAATDTGISDRRHQSLGSDSTGNERVVVSRFSQA